MSLLLTQIGAAVAPDQLWPDLTDALELSFDQAEYDLSFTYGPLPDDVIAAVDLLANVFDDGETPDEFDYSFSFTLLEDAQVYAGQFDEAPEPDEPDHSFTFTLLEDAQLYALAFDDDLSVDETDYDFSASIQDDVVVADEPPYQNFDDYDETFEGDEYSFYLGSLEDDPAIVPVQRDSDGDLRKKKPIVTIRPKAERDLDDVLELVNEVDTGRRNSENRKTLKVAVAIIRAIEPQPSYEKPIAEIKKALVNVSRNTAKHEGAQAAIARIERALETLIAEMERKRKRRRREEEEIILWLTM